MPEQCTPGSRRYQYTRQMSFLLQALQNKKPRYSYSQDKYESYSEVSNSPSHPPPEDMPKIKNESLDKPLDLKTKHEETRSVDKGNQVAIENGPRNPSLEIKIDANSILPDDHFDDDKLFMNSLLPLFKKMDDDTRLLCRIEVLKIIRYALQGHKSFEALKLAEDSFFKDRISGILAKEEVDAVSSKNDSKLSMTTRSADGSRPVRKRKSQSPSPQPMPPKKRGPGRPRKIRPPPSDSEDEHVTKKRSPKAPKLSSSPLPKDTFSEMDESINKATSVTQLSAPMFMKMYNLGRSKNAPQLTQTIKSEPIDDPAPS